MKNHTVEEEEEVEVEKPEEGKEEEEREGEDEKEGEEEGEEAKEEEEEEGVVGQKKRGNGKSHFRWKVPMMERGTKATGNIIFAYGKD